MKCDMCGSEAGKMHTTIIEGARLQVCHECSKYGKVVGIVQDGVQQAKEQKQVRRKQQQQDEIIDVLVDNFTVVIRNKRQELGLKQEELAKKLNEKESIIHQVESGHFNPNLGLVKKLERFLQVKLTQAYKETHEKAAKQEMGKYTLGDFIKIKKSDQ